MSFVFSARSDRHFDSHEQIEQNKNRRRNEQKMKIRQSESIALSSHVDEDVLRTVIAFANCEGGRIYVGVEEGGTVVGLENAENEMLKANDLIREAVKPDLTPFVTCRILTAQAKNLLEIHVQPGTDRPYFLSAKGLRPEGVFIRRDAASLPGAKSTIERMIRETDGDQFEDRRSLEQELTFDQTARFSTSRKMAFTSDQMQALGLQRPDGIYTNLGLLLSDQCPYSIKAAVIQDDPQNLARFRQEFTGSLFRQMEDAYLYIDFHNNTKSVINGFFHEETRDYPPAAIREALFNLLVHRAYDYTASSLIRMYADRIEFVSIGGLMNGFSLKDAELGVTMCRNPKLAEVFSMPGLMEGCGTGLKRIMRAYEGQGACPQIEVSDNAFKITLPNLNGQIRREQQEQKTPEEMIIALVKQKGFITRKDVEEMSSLSQATSGRLLKKMVEDEILVSQDRGKRIRYRLA